MIKAVIFDLDGTVSDTVSTIAHFGNMALEYYGLPPIDTEKFKYFAGDGKVVLLHRMLEYHDADTEEMFKKVEAKYDAEYEADPIYITKPFDGVIDELKKLKERGIKLAVLSNKPDNVTVMVAGQLFGDLFDIVHGKRENIPTKPDPEGTVILMEELGVTKDECVFVGDTNVDIFTAKNVGMKSIGVLWGFRDEKELSSAKADYIIEKTDEIFNTILKIENEQTREK